MSITTRGDVYNYGLPRGCLVVHARAVASVSTGNNTLEVEGHGCDLNTPIQFSLDDGGTVAAPLAVGAVYYAKPVDGSESLLQVASAADGAAIDLTTSGEGMRLIIPIGPLLDALGEFYTQWLYTMLVGHEVPLAPPYPVHCVAIVATRVAAHAARVCGLSNAQDLYEAERLVIADAIRLSSGVPLRDASATAASNLATSAAPTSDDHGSTVIL